jgi:putative ABC transport system substrate-binding protein
LKRIGVLMHYAADDAEAQDRVSAFETELQRYNWRQGRNVQIEHRFASGDFDLMHKFAKELVALPCSLIVTTALSPVIAARREDPAIPIVFANCPNPVEQGLIGSLSHPDQNMTGIAGLDYPSIIGKWVGLLKAIAPDVTRVGIMFNPDAYYSYLPPPPGSYWVRQLEAVASSFAVATVAVPVRNLLEMRSALAVHSREPGCGLLVATDVFTLGHYRSITSLALEHRVPICYPYRFFAAEGGLLSYGSNGAQASRLAASYVDRILQGADPKDLPIRRPTTLELVINLKTARALGLVVPPVMLATADEVIE